MNVAGTAATLAAGHNLEVTKFRSGVLRLWSGDGNLSQPEPKEPGPNPNAANVEHTSTPEVRRRQARLERAVLARLEHEQPIGKSDESAAPKGVSINGPKANLIALSVDAMLGLMFRPSSQPKLDAQAVFENAKQASSRKEASSMPQGPKAAETGEAHGSEDATELMTSLSALAVDEVTRNLAGDWRSANENRLMSPLDLPHTSTVVALIPQRHDSNTAKGRTEDTYGPYSHTKTQAIQPHRLDLVA